MTTSKKIYLDQNIIQYLVENVPSEQFKNILLGERIILHLSILNIFEFARLFRNREKANNVKNGKWKRKRK